jgi:hypothetical protein
VIVLLAFARANREAANHPIEANWNIVNSICLFTIQLASQNISEVKICARTFIRTQTPSFFIGTYKDSWLYFGWNTN